MMLTNLRMNVIKPDYYARRNPDNISNNLDIFIVTNYKYAWNTINVSNIPNKLGLKISVHEA